MPAYWIEFTTEQGPQRLRFTLDQDRSLAPQLRQVLEEMRQRGMVLQGGPDDELVVLWNGGELDGGRSLLDLGVSPQRSIELRMRSRRPPVPEPRPEPIAPPPRPPAKPPAQLSSWLLTAPVLGMCGALLAWLAASSLTELGGVLAGYGSLDVAAGALLGAGIGAMLRAGDARRHGRGSAAPALAGMALAGAGGLLGALLARLLLAGLASPDSFALARVLSWTVLGAAVAAGLAVRRTAGAGASRWRGVGYGAAAGALAGVVFSLPGVADFWQALAFVTVGAGVGMGICDPTLLQTLRGPRGAAEGA